MAGTFLSHVPHWSVCVSALFPPFVRLWRFLPSSVAYFLRACLSGAFPPFVGLWPVFSKRASVAFPPSMRLWHFFRPRVSGVSFVRASVAFSPCVRLWRFSSLRASVVLFFPPYVFGLFPSSMRLWCFLRLWICDVSSVSL